jgi:hypothetical protein
VLLFTTRNPQAIKPIVILESREIYFSHSGKSCEYIVYSGFILPLLQVHLEQVDFCGGFFWWAQTDSHFAPPDVYFISAV